MAWLLNPADYDTLIGSLAQVQGLPRAGLGAIEVVRDPRVEPGHIRDGKGETVGVYLEGVATDDDEDVQRLILAAPELLAALKRAIVCRLEGVRTISRFTASSKA